MSLLKIKNLTVKFATATGAFTAVDGIDVSVDKHEVLAIVGESGSGKSVSMLAVMGLLPDTATITADEMVFDGINLLAMSPQERVMIAIAIASKPRLLIADEPTTALDVTIQKQILDLLMKLQEEYGMALILITHDMGVVAETADRVVVQYKGRKMEEADVLSLFEAPQHPYTKALLSALPENATGDRLPTVSDFFGKEGVR